jgi:hypothetical protein
MKKPLLSILLTSTLFVTFASAPVYADKPQWAGQGQAPTYEQKEMHKSTMQDKRGSAYDKHNREYDNKQGRYEDRDEDHDKQRHDDRYEDRDDEHDKQRDNDRYEDRDGGYTREGSDKRPQPNEDTRGFQQRMKDMLGW